MAEGANQPPTTTPTISTHVLDTGMGAPAVGVPVTLSRLSDDGRPLRLTQALTDHDGRVRDLLERQLVVGRYRLEFDLAPRSGDEAATIDRFFQRISVDLLVGDATRSYHVPLLLAPYSLSTYRGS